MYAYIEGIIEEITEKYAVIDNQGIGYEIYMPSNDLSKLVHHENIKIYTYYSSTDNGTFLYGFLTKEEKRLFLLLISVSGVGPKGAMAILSVLSPEDLTYAIIGENVKAITAANGIGTKAAQKIIVELKDKLDLGATIESSLAKGEAGVDSSIGTMKNNVLSGLTALGFSSSDAIRALNEVDMDEDVTEEYLLKAALSKLKR